MQYTITIDDTLVSGLDDILAQSNAQNIQRRQAPFADMTAFLTQSVVATAHQGLSNIATAASQKVTSIALDNTNTITPDALIAAVQAYAAAPLDKQAEIKTLLGIG